MDRGEIAMQVVRTVKSLREHTKEARARGQKLGLVPTMGALHEGHLSLVQEARVRCGWVGVSIFVNPTQFGPKEDLTRYPRPLERDLALCQSAGVDLVFQPDVAEMYPPGFQTCVEVEKVQQVLEGAARPGHFRGVATVVLKLFQQFQPDVAFFGQKDAQQVRVIEQMVHDLDVPVELHVCPIVRESDGLAMSSRNVYLSPEQRRRATVLFQALEHAKHRVEAGERSALELGRQMVQMIEATPGATLDYVAIVNPQTFEPVTDLAQRALALLAVRFGSTRLIDNAFLP
jgi:pantoate--beta-alanine ligase